MPEPRAQLAREDATPRLKGSRSSPGLLGIGAVHSERTAGRELHGAKNARSGLIRIAESYSRTAAHPLLTPSADSEVGATRSPDQGTASLSSPEPGLCASVRAGDCDHVAKERLMAGPTSTQFAVSLGVDGV